MQGTNRSGEGEKSLLCDPGFELRLGGRDKRRAEITTGKGKTTTTTRPPGTTAVGKCTYSNKYVLRSTEYIPSMYY